MNIGQPQRVVTATPRKEPVYKPVPEPERVPVPSSSPTHMGLPQPPIGASPRQRSASLSKVGGLLGGTRRSNLAPFSRGEAGVRLPGAPTQRRD